MADQKISQLAAATTPLAGTEVLPIVQGGVTKQVSVDNLTAGKAVSASTLTTTSNVTVGNDLQVSRLLQMKDGAGAGSLRTIITYDALNDLRIATGTSSGARSIFLQTEGVDQFKVDAAGNANVLTGNLVIGTSGKGIDFSATSGTGTSELFDDYEEGTFTPTVSGATTAGTGTYTARNGRYTKIGNVVYFVIDYILSAHTGTGDTLITGLPFTSGSAYYCNIVVTAQNLSLTALYYIGGSIIANGDTKIYFQQMPVGGGSAIGIPIDPVCDVRLSGFYFV
jgi:hypothetical protein